MYTVTFCGHRQVAEQGAVRAWLDALLPELYAQGARRFYLGGYGDFDSLAASAVLALRERHADVEAVLVKPYMSGGPEPRPGMETVYPPLESVPPCFAIARRNRWMVENADCVVAYVLASYGGASATLHHARARGCAVCAYPALHP